MTAWWYSENEKKSGPIEHDDLKSLILSGKIGPRTLLWKEGMESWLHLDDIDELKVAVPPPLPLTQSKDPLTYSFAYRVSRLFARNFDLFWESSVVGFILGAVLGRYSSSFVEWINGPGASQLFWMLCIPIALILDAAVYRVVGNTPGKAFLGLKVGLLDSTPLNFGQYLSRNFSMWVSGLALGFPLINFFTMARQSYRLDKGLQTSYDESTEYRVRAKHIGWVRKLVFIIAFTGFIAVVTGFDSKEQTAQREESLNGTSENYSWTNPTTGLSATINSQWKNSIETNPDGQQTYMFSERTGRAVVILGVEHAPGFSLDNYVQAFRKTVAMNMRFTDSGRYFDRSGRKSWEGSGEIVGSKNDRLDVQVVLIDDAFWRMVTVQAQPYEYSDPLVKQLQTEIWNSVFQFKHE
ncbi:MAG: RDD family protein [Methylobacter sp.]